MLYEYRCTQCGEPLEKHNKIEERHTGAPVHCGQRAVLEIRTAPRDCFVDNMEEYRCPVTGQGVTTRRQRNEIMAREGLVDANDHLSTWENRQKKTEAAQEAYRKSVEEEPKVIREEVDKWARQELGL